MKKIFTISFVALFSLGLISCNKEKKCTCNYVSKAIDITPDGEWEGLLDYYNSEATSTGTIEKGECSDLNEVATSTNMGIQITTTLTCTEK